MLPDEPLGETAVVVLLFYLDVKCFRLYTYSSNLSRYRALCQQRETYST